MCRALEVSRARYYQWRGRPQSAHAARDTALLSRIQVTFAVAKRRYGSPRVRAELAAQGEHVSAKRVARLMRHAGLYAKRPGRFRRTTRSDHAWPVAPNLVARPFHVAQPDQVWGADMTFLPTREGWLYLAVLLDLCSRRVVGWALSPQLDQHLALRALEMALVQRGSARGVTHHSDRGTPYASHAYRARLAAAGLACSMSRAGDCWDNAMVESFFATLKTEADHVTWPTRAAARTEIGEFVEGWYNRRRRHSALGALSPVDFERQHHSAA
jgi:transposase InsO family protein